MIAFISAGAIQLLVAPASASSRLQMKVRSSTRATSVGSEAQWNEFGFLSGSSRVKVPAATSCSVSSVHSRSDPVHQWMASGWVSSATSSTQAASRAWVVPPARSSPSESLSRGVVSAVIFGVLQGRVWWPNPQIGQRLSARLDPHGYGLLSECWTWL